MSRIGKLPITLPSGLKFVANKSELSFSGSKGQLKIELPYGLELSQESDRISIATVSDTKRNRALHGLYRSLVYNAVKGVSEGFRTSLELVGVGYRVELKGKTLEFSLGYSHNIIFVLPKEVNAEVVNEKGQNPKVHLSSFDKQLLGQVVAKIRGLRKPEPYKGKGVRIVGEYIRRKVGKAAGKGKK